MPDWTHADAAFGRVYAGWAFSQTFFRAGLYRELGHATQPRYSTPGKRSIERTQSCSTRYSTTS